jgi:hypothetical protein
MIHRTFPLTVPWCAVMLLALTAALTAAPRASAQSSPIDPAKAKQYFEEARTTCERDGGRLWGKSLCGPMLFVDAGTGAVAANQQDAESRLVAQDGIYVGRLPHEISPANTAMNWAGVHWTMVMWPLPVSPSARLRLMMHELYHRIQDDLGLPAASTVNAHLATLEGRIWLLMEWRALEQALARPEAPAMERKRAVEDALLFRLRRRALFAKAAEEERQLEINEGLAEYTGYKLRGTEDPATVEAVMGRLRSAESDEAFSRSFAYESGPAYGLLLDLSGRPWRTRLTAKSDLGDMLRAAYNVTLPQDIAVAAERRMAMYDGAAVRWHETQQDEQRKADLEKYKKRLMTDPVLVLPTSEHFNFSFDPTEVIPIDDNNSIYATIRVTENWGILEVSNGALMVREQGRPARVVVEAPQDYAGKSEISGNGWKLKLAAGWAVMRGERPGDLTVAPKE